MASPSLVLDSSAPGSVDGRHLRAAVFQDVRLQYVTKVMDETSGKRAAVIGGGRGLLAQGLARLGMEVASVDPSPEATTLARVSDDSGAVVYSTAPFERPGLPEGTFDLVYCADTFEITEDLDAVLAAVARSLRPGSTLIYDTVNRTPISRLVYLGMFQRVPGTRIMPPGRYSAARLRPPAELADRMTAHGLTNLDTCSFKPRSVGALISATRARRADRVTDDQLSSMVDFKLDPNGPPVVTYLGHARRN
ncbi:methyltransferase domain-containing protein [Actinomadura madurae]|uniref:class I SAM-dependent methyltransferase n=1 Tax=Actinomadura madurae TaxID=1993 RepID=UPI002026539A|nr:methyltransferase domain-containing protein [Actinomadura madurae]URN05431.1 methyltransferase domain-containing protein [Actinomadura madurae]